MTNKVDLPERAGPVDPTEGRVFVRDGFRSFRKTYRVREAYWGAGILAFLAGVLGWVRYRGAHPDPSLFDMSAALATNPLEPARLAPERSEAELRGAAPRHPSATQGREQGAEVPIAQRGALPAGLGSGGFGEGKIGAYTPDNLYVKINGRAEFYQSFGVQSMHAVTLDSPTGASIEIELYDLGEARNALGTYNGERPPEKPTQFENGTYFRFDRNAAFVARGPYYVRFVGSDESPAVLAEVQRLVQLFKEQLPGAELPWAFSLFVDQLKIDASAVSYARENAFSFGFASDVYKATLSAPDAVDTMEAFVVVKAGAVDAKAEAKQYQEGFKGLGVPGGKTPAGVPLFKDEFLGTFSTATSSERWVIGVRGAPSAARAAEVLKQLEQGLRALPADVLERAQPSAAHEAEPSSAASAASAAPAASAGGEDEGGAGLRGAAAETAGAAQLEGGEE